jgi:hypothetical protein
MNKITDFKFYPTHCIDQKHLYIDYNNELIGKSSELLLVNSYLG